MNAYINRGRVKLGLNNIDEAEVNLQKALELAKQQENIDAKAFVEEELQQLNQMNSKHKNDKQPRRGGAVERKSKDSRGFLMNSLNLLWHPLTRKTKKYKSPIFFTNVIY